MAIQVYFKGGTEKPKMTCGFFLGRTKVTDAGPHKTPGSISKFRITDRYQGAEPRLMFKIQDKL